MAALKAGAHYTTPNGTQIAAYGGFWRRFAASGIVWFLCFWVPLVITFFVLIIGSTPQVTGADDGMDDQTFWNTSAPFLILAFIILAYFTYFLRRGRSLGMRAVGLRMVNATTGGRPGLGRSLVRAFLNLILAISAYGAFFSLSVFGESARVPLTALDILIAVMIYLVFSVLVLGHFRMIRDPRKQTWQDKVSGVVVIGKMSPSSRP